MYPVHQYPLIHLLMAQFFGILLLTHALVAIRPPSRSFAVRSRVRSPSMRSFSPEFIEEFEQLMHWRRDVRRFRTDDVPEAVLSRALAAFTQAPSVGLSEPWRIIRIESEHARMAALANFEAANAQALDGYAGEKAAKYASLKLSGMREAPIQLAVYCDDQTTKGAGLGAGTMPEMREYSVVGAIMLFWLAARSVGLGCGWVSIFDPIKLSEDLRVPAGWTLVGYLCVGWPETDNERPELEQLGWEERAKLLNITSI